MYTILSQQYRTGYSKTWINCPNHGLEVLRKFWESPEKVIRKSWKILKKFLKKSWESPEKVLRKSWKILKKVLKKKVLKKSWESQTKSWKSPETVLRKSWESPETFYFTEVEDMCALVSSVICQSVSEWMSDHGGTKNIALPVRERPW